jgi:hypothetical protein
MGYDVKGLDRVMYATLTKKNVERGKWRFLAEKEIRLLKYLNASYKKPIVKAEDKSAVSIEKKAEKKPVKKFKKETKKETEIKKPSTKAAIS